ncbi:MAG: hypothetical protein GC162_08140 [Planctomycetes bacterium]|nr:hypothetical protein [Planctomycetota bacterium]
MSKYGLFLLLTVLSPFAIAPAAVADELSDLKARNAQLEMENVQLRSELDTIRKQIAQMKGELTTTQQQTAELKTQLTEAKKSTEDLTAEKMRLEQLAGMTAKGEAVDSAIARIQTDYDDKADRTTVTSAPVKVPTSGVLALVDHKILFQYTSSGKSAGAAPDKMSMIMTVNKHASNRYKFAKSIDLTVDGKALSLPVTNYEVTDQSRVNTGKGFEVRYDERITFSLTDDSLRALARASDAKAEFSGNTLEIPREVLAVASAMVERMKMSK